MDVETVVIGAGVIGLAAARELALRGREVMVLEQHPIIGSQTSARNSEVIHAGIYYPAGSLKARACLAGREMLYSFCREHGVAHRRLGKLIVATAPEQVEALVAIRARAEANGVDDLAFLDRAEALALEPQLACEAALLSPSTGILDSHAFMLALQGSLEACGGQVVCGAEVTGLAPVEGGYRLTVTDGTDGFALTCRSLVIAAGHGAPSLAGQLAGTQAPQAYFARGCYFSIAGRAPFSRLVYPVPEPGGLGVHLTLDMGGQARFGPDVEWIDSLDYTVDPRRADGFYAEIRKYWPGLADGALRPDYSGIRPKISGPDAPAADFRIDGPREHGHAGLVALYGIESPGLTSALALAGIVADRLEA